LPVELVAHFTLHIDVAAQQIRRRDNLCIRGPDTVSVHAGDVQVVRVVFVDIALKSRSNCGTFHIPNNSVPYSQMIAFNTRENEADRPEVAVAVPLIL